jgi:hypothetical protein
MLKGWGKITNGQSWNNYNKINKVVLDYNPKDKINGPESMLL